MYEKDEYIQLPPLKRNLEANAVLLIWEFAKMSEEARGEVLEDMELINSRVGNAALPEKYRIVTKEELADYEDALGRLMRSIVYEASDIACWVFCKKYIDEWSLEQMIGDMPSAEKFIIIMDTLFEKLVAKKDSNEYPN